MALKDKPRSINSFFRFVTIFPIAYFAIFFVTTIVLSFLAARLGQVVFVYILIGFSVLMLALYVLYAVYTTHQFQRLVVRGLYNITTYNFNNISDNNNVITENNENDTDNE